MWRSTHIINFGKFGSLLVNFLRYPLSMFKYFGKLLRTFMSRISGGPNSQGGWKFLQGKISGGGPMKSEVWINCATTSTHTKHLDVSRKANAFWNLATYN